MVSDDAFMVASVMGRKHKAYRADTEAYIRELEEYIDQLSLRFAVESAVSEGRRRQLVALINHHPETPLAKRCGVRFRDGDEKTYLDVVYEDGFDSQLKDLIGVRDPSEYRKA